MESADFERLCGLLVEAHRQGRRFATGEQPALRDLSDAYRVQADVVRALAPGSRVDTWKISPPRGEVPSTAAPILPGCRLAAPATVNVSGFKLLGVEAEVAFRFGDDLPPRYAPYPDADVIAAVREIAVVIELCDTRLSDWQDASPLWRLADLQTGARLIVGDSRSDWRGIDFARQDVELWINGKLRVRERGTHPTVDPTRLLPAIAAHCALHADGLRAGDIVTTGSWTGMTHAAPGDAIRVHFPGIGSAQLALAC